MRRTVYRQAKKHETWHKRDQSYSEETPKDMMNEEQLMILGEIEEEQNEHVRQALLRLSERQREVVFLKFYGGLSNEEISQVLGVNRQSVYNYIYRAITILQETLSHSYTG
jgi:RNA polymerase sigma-70 factor (ECF subfamily)